MSLISDSTASPTPRSDELIVCRASVVTPCRARYAPISALGMCLPSPVSTPKTKTLLACCISGSASESARFASRVPFQASITVCRLTSKVPA